MASRDILDRELIANGSNNNIRNPVLKRKRNNDKQGDLTYDGRVTRYQQALGDSTRALNPDREITPKINNQLENNMDDTDSDSIADDDKTNVSELAKDRTQRAFDSTPAPRAEIHYTTSDTTGENVALT